MRSQHLETQLPVLRNKNYDVTSPRDRSYNCAAWAGGDDNRWWEPARLGGYYWPAGLPERDWRVSNYQRAYEQHGFVACADGSLEAGVEKIAIYERQGNFCHASRQLEDGRWTSKCGQHHDITHDTPDDLAGGQGYGYGDVAVFMQRTRST
ncbi:DUF7689 domain-containing protein [Mycobacterium paragordonae]|uniref:DUF7689 domain-containing protein n=1 Tax=Mycobacterium paragordonae TaxID=1389713 RepID=UPI003B968FC5